MIHHFIELHILFLFFLCLIPQISNAQVTQEWVRRHNGPGNGMEISSVIAIDGSGNIIIAGTEYSSLGDWDFLIKKYDSLGTVLWQERYNGGANWSDVVNAFAVDASGNIYVTGGSSASGNTYDIATVKFNSAGVIQWVNKYNGSASGHDAGMDIKIDASGNVYVTGYSDCVILGDNFITIKYNSAGSILWTAFYGSPVPGAKDYADRIVINTTHPALCCGNKDMMDPPAAMIVRVTLKLMHWEMFI